MSWKRSSMTRTTYRGYVLGQGLKSVHAHACTCVQDWFFSVMYQLLECFSVCVIACLSKFLASKRYITLLWWDHINLLKNSQKFRGRTLKGGKKLKGNIKAMKLVRLLTAKFHSHKFSREIWECHLNENKKLLVHM